MLLGYHKSWSCLLTQCAQGVQSLKVCLCMNFKYYFRRFQEYIKAVYCHPCLFNLYAEYIMWNARLDEVQTGIKIAGRNINNLRYADDTTLMAESDEELTSLLMKVKEESEKVGLKLNIQKTKIMASRPITSWQIEEETMETLRLYFGGLQNHCRWWLQPWNLKMLAPWKKSYDKSRQHIKKHRHYFANKCPSGQSYSFSSSHVWILKLYYKECWALKNWCFWTVVLERLLRVPWTARRSNQSTLREISPEYSLEGLMLKLKCQYFGYLMQRTDWLEKTLMLGKIEGGRRRGR